MAGKSEELVSENSSLMDQLEALRKDLATKNAECETYKAKAARFELDLIETRMKAAQHQSEMVEIHKMKDVSEEMLTKAKSIIFEKVKLCKNQELQIEALNAQVISLKDVVAITKNLLEIRSLEVGHLQDQINAMNGKVTAEKERQDLIHEKLSKMIRMNAELKREYEAQLILFNALRDRYSERELAKNVVNNLKKDQMQESNEDKEAAKKLDDEDKQVTCNGEENGNETVQNIDLNSSESCETSEISSPEMEN